MSTATGAGATGGPIQFVKGHGTENDFIILPDPDGRLGPVLTPELVRALCDRRAGLGADGVLRVVARGADPGATAMAGEAQWFMDYRNADGSTAEMCGNGARVFARYLVDSTLARPGELTIATRGGVRRAWAAPTGDVTVEMGPPELLAARPRVLGRAGTAVSMGNPHVVVMLADDDELAALDLSRPPVVNPPLPDGQNVEFVVRRGPRRIGLRVHERGVGETRSCGTGVCAAAVAVISRDGGDGRGAPWTVDVPGGRLTVTWTTWTGDGAVHLTGPAVLVAAGELSPNWVAATAGGLPIGPPIEGRPTSGPLSRC